MAVVCNPAPVVGVVDAILGAAELRVFVQVEGPVGAVGGGGIRVGCDVEAAGREGCRGEDGKVGKAVDGIVYANGEVGPLHRAGFGDGCG